MSNSGNDSKKIDPPLFHRRTGNGPKVLLIHGFGEDHRIWDNLIPELEDHYELIIPDLPGTGASPAIADMSLEGMAARLISLLPDEPIHVVGHSMGGYITLAMLEKYPGRLNSLTLFHSTSYADSEEKKASRRKGIEFIQQYGAFEFLKTTIPNLFSPLSRQKMPEMVKEFIDRQRSTLASSLIAYYEAMMARPDRRQLLQNCQIPVLFLLGKHDIAVPITDGLAQCHLPGISYIHILDHSGHMGMLEEPELSFKSLKNFLLQAQTHQ